MPETIHPRRDSRQYPPRPSVRYPSQSPERQAAKQREIRAADAFFQSLARLRANGNESLITAHFDRFCEFMDTGPVHALDEVLYRVGRTNRAQDEARDCLVYESAEDEAARLHRFILETNRDMTVDHMAKRAARARLAQLKAEQ